MDLFSQNLSNLIDRQKFRLAPAEKITSWIFVKRAEERSRPFGPLVFIGITNQRPEHQVRGFLSLRINGNVGQDNRSGARPEAINELGPEGGMRLKILTRMTDIST